VLQQREQLAQPATAPGQLLRANRVIQVPDFHLEDRLTPEHVDFFETYGSIRFKQFLPRERAQELHRALDELTAELVRKGADDVNGVPLIKGKRDDGSPYFGRIPFASLQHPEFRKFLRDPRFQAIIDDLAPGSRLGEDERDGLVVNRFRNEPGAKYKNLGWHTDSLRDLAYLEKPRRYLNVGFSITDSPMRVGGLRLLPCTHNQSVASMLTTKIHFFDMKPDPNELAVETEAGDLTIHDGRLWHRTALAEVTGDASERCVTYLPIMDGPVIRKHEKSPTPVYFHLKKLLGY
jgi:hypothetical protein